MLKQRDTVGITEPAEYLSADESTIGQNVNKQSR